MGFYNREAGNWNKNKNNTEQVQPLNFNTLIVPSWHMVEEDNEVDELEKSKL